MRTKEANCLKDEEAKRIKDKMKSPSFNSFKANLVESASTFVKGRFKGKQKKDQKKGFETFSPVVKMVTVRVVLALAAAYNWNLHQMDAYNAFLQGDLTKESFTTVEYDQYLNLKEDEKLPDAGPYQRLVRKLMYLTMTRPDISYAVHVLRLCKELGAEVELPMELHYDSKAAIQITANPTFHERTKHIEIDLHFIRERIQQGVIKTIYVISKVQEADLFTKAMGRSQHEYLMSNLGVLNLFAPSSLMGSVEEKNEHVPIT
ncbi:uncharacterized protein LOC142173731 [Nicotiana tabacum]|uniref:Uncharacterized protein LOC142173731 n=1 Tax=Nicotiana tabacum TaxID=4097 RepID=A0AC58TE11_TOBAC